MNRLFAFLAVAVLALGCQAGPAPQPQAGAPEDAPLWTIAWITDTQTPAEPWIEKLIDAVEIHKPRVVLHTGDARFEWANQCAWKHALRLMNSASPPAEFHLAIGNHDNHGPGQLKGWLARAASQGVYILDTGKKEEGKGYYHNRVTQKVSGPEYPAWSPEVAANPNWRPGGGPPYRYVFKRGGIRFIVLDCYYSEAQGKWLREFITKPDDSSVTIVMQHDHNHANNPKYFEGLEGKHNVKLMLTGHDHNWKQFEAHGVTFLTGAGMANGHFRDSDAAIIRVYKNRLQMDRYVIPKETQPPVVRDPVTVWTCKGEFSAYVRPEYPKTMQQSAAGPQEKSAAGRTEGPNLIRNGGFDNGIWYERFRGWSPSCWYQWFTRGNHAPEHAIGKHGGHPAHSGKEFVRIHMWAHAWRGGILQNVKVEPCRWYRLTAYGFFQPPNSPNPKARVGLDPAGTLAKQYSGDVSKHPAGKYDEGVGDDPKSPEKDGPDVEDTTVWTEYKDYYKWGKFEVEAEARSDTATAILYCYPDQRPAEKPIYEMNWDSVRMVEIPWPTKRLVREGAVIQPQNAVKDMIVRHQPQFETAQVTWRTEMPAGASQVLYRFLDSEAQNHFKEKDPKIQTGDFPFETQVEYETSEKTHQVEIRGLKIPESAVEMQVVCLSRALVGGECRTFCSPVVRVKFN